LVARAAYPSDAHCQELFFQQKAPRSAAKKRLSKLILLGATNRMGILKIKQNPMHPDALTA
jgi:hypothetical protein